MPQCPRSQSWTTFFVCVCGLFVFFFSNCKIKNIKIIETLQVRGQHLMLLFVDLWAVESNVEWFWLDGNLVLSYTRRRFAEIWCTYGITVCQTNANRYLQGRLVKEEYELTLERKHTGPLLSLPLSCQRPPLECGLCAQVIAWYKGKGSLFRCTKLDHYSWYEHDREHFALGQSFIMQLESSPEVKVTEQG